MDTQNNIQSPQSQSAQSGISSTGLQPNAAAALSYLLGFITGVVFYLISKEKYIRFHAMQSIITSLVIMVAQMVLGFIPFIGIAISPLIGLGSFVLFIVLMVKAYRGEMFRLPVIGDLADKNS